MSIKPIEVGQLRICQHTKTLYVIIEKSNGSTKLKWLDDGTVNEYRDNIVLGDDPF
jgi:hypothetical protein